MIHPILGQLAGGSGKQLPVIPANATNGEIIATMNEVIGRLNNNNRDIVDSGTIDVILTANTNASIAKVRHNLGYKPKAFVYLNDVNINIDPNFFSGVDIPLPTYLAEFIPTGFGGSGSGLGIQFTIWMDIFVDETYLYIHTINGLQIAAEFPVSWELTREPSN